MSPIREATGTCVPIARMIGSAAHARKERRMTIGSIMLQGIRAHHRPQPHITAA